MPSLVFLSLAIALMWTVRLARAKGRNPWIWAGAAVAPMLVSAVSRQDAWQLLSMVPMMVLLFSKAPQPRSSPGPEGIACPRCTARHPHGRYYCTNCGWELAKPYTPEILVPPEVPAASNPPEPMHSKLPVASPWVSQAPVQGPLTEETTGVEAPPAAEAQPTEPEPVADHAEAPKPVSFGVPTAAGMTERGLNLFNLGRLQESIDQFTKAIALDGAYTPAWEARAEAYGRLGRDQEAEKDRRQIRSFGTV